MIPFSSPSLYDKHQEVLEMNIYTSFIKAQLAEYLRQNQSSSVIECLCDCYLSYYPIENNAADFYSQEIDPLIPRLSFKRKHRICYLIARFCSECQRRAFTLGFRVGIALAAELVLSSKNE